MRVPLSQRVVAALSDGNPKGCRELSDMLDLGPNGHITVHQTLKKVKGAYVAHWDHSREGMPAAMWNYDPANVKKKRTQNQEIGAIISTFGVHMLKPHAGILRYSPQPIEAYTQHGVGPDRLKFLQEPEAWNLAYLSHPFEVRPLHPDPQFTVHIRYTVKMHVPSGTVDLTGARRASSLFGQLLTMPAPWLLAWMRRNPTVVTSTPLYKAYGSQWLQTVISRERLCEAYQGDVDDEVVDLTYSRELLRHIAAQR